MVEPLTEELFFGFPKYHLFKYKIFVLVSGPCFHFPVCSVLYLSPFFLFVSLTIRIFIFLSVLSFLICQLFRVFIFQLLRVPYLSIASCSLFVNYFASPFVYCFAFLICQLLRIIICQLLCIPY